MEVTFEASRAHLGVETQRQWSDLAMERTTPALFDLFSLVTLLARTLKPDSQTPTTTNAWYLKTEPTFTDFLALARQALWGNFTFQTAPANPDLLLVPRSILDRLALTICFWPFMLLLMYKVELVSSSTWTIFLT
jgi:hypothetical protein